MIVAIGIGRDAPRALRDRVALDAAGVERVLRSVPEGIDELVAVSTCHRTELYASTSGSGIEAAHHLAALLPGLGLDDAPEVRTMRDAEAAEHLFRVACGLDSLVLGEWEILGQLRRAYARARSFGTAGPELSHLFSRALSLGRRARVANAFAGPRRSLGTLAAEEIGRRLGGLSGRHGAVVGAGEAASDAATALSVGGARLTVLSRTHASAQRLATELGGDAGTLQDLGSMLPTIDFAVAGVAGGIVLHRDDLAVRNGRSPLLLVDLSVPRAIDPNVAGAADLVSLEDLRPIDDGGFDDTIAGALRLIAAEMHRFEQRSREPGRSRAIRQLREHAAAAAAAEARKLHARLDLGPEQAAEVLAMAQRLANKLIHAPTVALRDGDDQTGRVLADVYGFDRTNGELP